MNAFCTASFSQAMAAVLLFRGSSALTSSSWAYMNVKLLLLLLPLLLLLLLLPGVGEEPALLQGPASVRQEEAGLLPVNI
jgi:hypothetical protein